MKFTGFMEITYEGDRVTSMLTTVTPVELSELLARVSERLADAPAGINVRIDLIGGWDE